MSTERAAIPFEVYRRNGAWKARHVSAGWETGLAALVTERGVTVDEAPRTHLRAGENDKRSARESLLVVPRVDGAHRAHGQERIHRQPRRHRIHYRSGKLRDTSLDLEQMFQVVLTTTDIHPENTWWQIGFDPVDAINEYSARRTTFTVRPDHTRPTASEWYSK